MEGRTEQARRFWRDLIWFSRIIWFLYAGYGGPYYSVSGHSWEFLGSCVLKKWMFFFWSFPSYQTVLISRLSLFHGNVDVDFPRLHTSTQIWSEAPEPASKWTLSWYCFVSVLFCLANGQKKKTKTQVFDLQWYEWWKTSCKFSVFTCLIIRSSLSQLMKCFSTNMLKKNQLGVWTGSAVYNSWDKKGWK